MDGPWPLRYHEHGWPPLRLPARAKYPPDEGRTGATGVDMTEDEIRASDWDGFNIGVRMPEGIIGLDVDAYHGGWDTLRDLVVELGPLPQTWLTHSSREDGSGTYYYTVPVGKAWAGQPGIDIIRHDHRYSLVAPSIHPDGRPYRWTNQRDAFTLDNTEIPRVDELPVMPENWVRRLAVDADNREHSRAANDTEVTTFLGTYASDDAPQCLPPILDRFRERTAGPRRHSRHDTMQHSLIWAMEEARAGLIPARESVDALRNLWIGAMAEEPKRQTSREFTDMVRHAVGRANAKSQEWLDAKHTEQAGIQIAGAEAPQPADSRLSEATEEAPAFYLDWHAFVNRDTEPRRWLIEGFWPWGRAMALWATAKEGKSELALWCTAKLAMGEHPWTGDPIDPIDVAYFDFEMTEDDLEDRLDDFGFDPLKLTHLHYALLPSLYPLNSDVGGEQIVELVRAVDAQAVVIDTFARSVNGPENDADTVQGFYRYTGVRFKQLGIAYLRTDHSGKDPGRGMRGTSGKRDDVDIAWRLRRGKTQLGADGAILDCTGSSRLSWVGPVLELDRTKDPASELISYTTPVQLNMAWPPGTAQKAQDLDDVGIPLDATVRAARAALDASAGKTAGRNATIAAALKYRRSPGLRAAVTPSGNTQNPVTGNSGNQPVTEASDLFSDEDEHGE